MAELTQNSRLGTISQLRQPDGVVYPHALDDEYTIPVVNNRSESRLAADIEPGDDKIIVETDMSQPEKWPPSGIATIDDEDIHYSETYSIKLAESIVRSADSLQLGAYQPTRIAEPGFIVVNALSKKDVHSDVNLSAIPDRLYTLIGQITIRSRRVLFAVSGVGQQGRGANFWFSDQQQIEIELCSFDASTMELFLAPSVFAMSMDWVYWKEDAADAFGGRAERVRVLSGLVRGHSGTVPAFHQKGTWVRQNIRAEHHNALAYALLELEKLAGIEWSEDRASLDFRLRDLDDPCVEGDECPAGVIHFTEEIDECFRVRRIHYRIELEGVVDWYEIDFGDGTKTTALEGSHDYPLGSTYEPRLAMRNDKCAVETTPTEVPVTPITVTLPDITCPQITCPPPLPTPELPTPTIIQPPAQTQIVELSCPQPDIPTTFVEVPTIITLSIPEFPTIINFTGPTAIDINTIITISVTVQHTFLLVGPTAEAPCFALVPCGSNTTTVIPT